MDFTYGGYGVMGAYAGIEPTWASQTNTGRTHIATKGVVQSGLVLNLDAGVLSSYPGSGTTWTDLSGNGNHGTLVNGVAYNSANGGSLVFDGSNDYVSNTMPNPGSLPITFDFWINPNDLSFSSLYDTAPNQPNVLRQSGANKVEWWNLDPDVSLGISVAPAWHNIIIEYSFTTNRTIKIYRNGNLITTATGSTNPAFAWTTLNFGIYNNTQFPYWGKISIIKIYNRALTAAEIQQNYLATKSRYFS